MPSGKAADVEREGLLVKEWRGPDDIRKRDSWDGGVVFPFIGEREN